MPVGITKQESKQRESLGKRGCDERLLEKPVIDRSGDFWKGDYFGGNVDSGLADRKDENTQQGGRQSWKRALGSHFQGSLK